MKFYKNTRVNAVKILRALRDEDGPITVGEIARRTGLHKWVVSRTLDVWMDPFVEVTILQELEAVGLRMKLVKLRGRPTEQQVLRALDVKKAMKR
ncbi:MAG: MarR family transcriptional regulator [Candidatus Aenigmarchaeota archaeon]|nr:MarR family transcriptional regulator [Candidatus Aenigmarchaeota archaeon]